MGRPTKYKPEMCAKVEELMHEGYSVAEVCRELDIDWHTYNSYREKYPEFLRSIKNGEFKSKGWWEGKCRQNIWNREFNAALWYMNMKNRFGWTDRPKDEDEEDRPAASVVRV
jgi:transposase-like protein